MAFSLNLSRERSEELFAWDIPQVSEGSPSAKYESQSNSIFDELPDFPDTEWGDVSIDADGADIDDLFVENDPLGNFAEDCTNESKISQAPSESETRESVSDPEAHRAVGVKHGFEAAVASDHDGSDSRSAKKLKRGHHVKGRTEMQENARLGQRHWANKVPELREEWRAKQVGSFDPRFERQVFMCERLRVKPQRECILLALQIATVDGLITPFAFSDAHDSLGWTGFWVVQEQASEFRARMQQVFPIDCKSTTVNNTFRRCGLIADASWDRAWRGLAPFVHNHHD